MNAKTQHIPTRRLSLSDFIEQACDVSDRTGLLPRELEEQRAELLDALRRILNAHDSDNNGAFMGEAVLCASFAAQARRAIAKAEGIEQKEVNPWRTDYAAIARATGESA